MQSIAPMLALFVAGLLTAVQTPTNAHVGKVSGSFVLTALLSATLSLAAAVIAYGVTRPKLNPDWTIDMPGWAWVGGIYGAIIIALSAYATPKTGAGSGLVVVVAAQIGLGIILDHFGLLGLDTHPATWLRWGGLAVMVGGALMVAKG